MSNTYIKGLNKELALKLNVDTIFLVSQLNSKWNILLANTFWKAKFIRDFGSRLPKEANYEIEYIVMGAIEFLPMLSYLSKKGYDEVLAVMYNKWPSYMELLSLAPSRNIKAFLLEYRRSLNDTEDDFLMLASIFGNIEIIPFLLDNGANIHAQNDKALILAVKYGRLDIVKLLVAYGADVGVIDDKALRDLMYNGYVNVYRFLVANGKR